MGDLDGELLLFVLRIDQRMPLGNRTSGSGQHVHPVPQLSTHTVGPDFGLTDRVTGTDAIVVNDGHLDGYLIDLIEGNLELE